MHRWLLPLTVAVMLAAPAAPSLAEDGADLILQHGVFYTVQPAGRVKGSLAVRKGRIVDLGADARAELLKGPHTQVYDLEGRAVTPGLIDAHSHLLGLGRALSEVDLTGALSYEEVVRRIQAAAARVPAGTWVRGRGWDQNRWQDKRFPTHEPLSAAVPGHPVWLTRVDGHAALVNAAAMRLLGLDATTKDPAGGRILRDEAGQPTGVLVDRAMGLADRLPGPTAEERQRWLTAAAQHCLAFGLTTVTDMGVSQGDYDAYAALRKAGKLPLRAALFLTDDEALLNRWLAHAPEIDPDARLTVRGVKLYADGALGSRGAALLEPYNDDPGNLGLLVTPGDHIEEVARRAAAAGYQIGIHAIGDRGALVAIDAMEKAMGGRPRPELRFRLEHTQVVRLQAPERMARLGIIASMQPTHATSDMPWAEARLGARRLERAYAWRKVLNDGGRLALGSDFPVESADPRLGLYAAVTRQDLRGNPPGGWLSAEKLTREEALRGFTLDAAWSLFLDQEIGSLQVGKRADLTVFARDIMEVPAAEIPKVQRFMTIVDGAI